ncbi:hypothetical protein XENOCAPTIV_010263 [Xenoophorus captivus]|uniref:Uncharacterized protein n=1 Tax=Xenoophorus captivus TaxID=1517983 RepID=A0ABV0RPW4_9TELE
MVHAVGRLDPDILGHLVVAGAVRSDVAVLGHILLVRQLHGKAVPLLERFAPSADQFHWVHVRDVAERTTGDRAFALADSEDYT